MEYKDIISITNKSGLFRLVGTKSDGAIVESLEDNTKMFLSSRKYNFTPLESIEVYTINDNVPLKEIFEAMKPKVKEVTTFDVKKASKDEMYSFIKSIYADVDTDRVYPSDIKKMVKWFGILNEKDLLNFDEPQAVVEEQDEKPKKQSTKKSVSSAVETETPKKKAAKKAAVPKSEKAEEDKPKKKAAAKKAVGSADTTKTVTPKKTAKKKD